MAIASTFSSAPSRLIVSRSRPLRSMKRTASPMISSRPRLPLPAGVVTAVDVLVRARWRPIAPPRSGMVTPLQPSAKLTGEDLRSWPADRAISLHVMLSPGPSVLVRPVGRHTCPGSSVRLRITDDVLDDRSCCEGCRTRSRSCPPRQLIPCAAPPANPTVSAARSSE